MYRRPAEGGAPHSTVCTNTFGAREDDHVSCQSSERRRYAELGACVTRGSSACVAEQAMKYLPQRHCYGFLPLGSPHQHDQRRTAGASTIVSAIVSVRAQPLPERRLLPLEDRTMTGDSNV